MGHQIVEVSTSQPVHERSPQVPAAPTVVDTAVAAPAAPTVVDTAVAAPAAPAPAPAAAAPAADPPVVKRFPAGSKVTIKGLTGAPWKVVIE